MNKNLRQFYLRDLIKIKNGKDYRTLELGSVPVYGTGGIISYVNDSLYEGESILLPRKGSLSNIMYVKDKFWTVDTMYWSEIKEEFAYPKYLYLYLSLLNLSHLDSGSTLPSMTFDSYYNIPISLPCMSVQKEIGNLIFSIIDKIQNNKQQIETLESLAKTIYDYWFVQFDFPNEDGRPYKSSGGKMVWNEELKREIPEGWSTNLLGKMCECKLGGTPTRNNARYWNGDINWINSGKVNDLRINECSEKITKDGLKNTST